MVSAPKVIQITVDGEVYVAVPAQLVGRVGAHIEQQVIDNARSNGAEPSGPWFAYALQLRAIAQTASEPRPEPSARSKSSVSGTVLGGEPCHQRLSCRDVANELGVSDSYIRRLARKDILRGELVSGVYLFEEAAVLSYKQQRRRTA